VFPRLNQEVHARPIRKFPLPLTFSGRLNRVGWTVTAAMTSLQIRVGPDYDRASAQMIND